MGRHKAICVNCIYHRRGDGTMTPWYDHRCGFEALPRAQDPVTGEWGYGVENDIGETIVIRHQFPDCRSINRDGKCTDYEPLGFAEEDEQQAAQGGEDE